MSPKDSNILKLPGDRLITHVDDNLDKDYKAHVDDMKASLEKVRSEIDEREVNGEECAGLFKEYHPALFGYLDKLINGLEEIASGFDEKGHKLHMEYLQRVIHPVVLESPFNKRCFEKPLGYPGDYMTMEMIYSDPCQGNSVFARILNVHSLSLPLVEAVRGRCKSAMALIEETTGRNPGSSILSVGAGPAWEVREFLRGRGGCDASFYFLDQDNEALQFVKKNLSGYTGAFHFINRGVSALIRERLTAEFDLIYSTGLSDYLSDRFARRLIQRLYGSLKEGGRLVIGNAWTNPHRVWMEHGSEWFLTYRNKETLLKLIEGLYPAPKNVYVRENEGADRLFLFLVVER